MASSPSPRLPPPRPSGAPAFLSSPPRPEFVLVAALLLGIAADTLLRSTPWGLNVTLVTVLFVTAGLLVARQSGIPLTGEGRWMAAPMLGFAAALAWRTSPTLSAANWFGLVTSSVLFVGASRSAQLHTARVIEYVKHLLVTLVASLTSFAPALFVESKLGSVLARGNSSALIAIVQQYRPVRRRPSRCSRLRSALPLPRLVQLRVAPAGRWCFRCGW